MSRSSFDEGGGPVVRRWPSPLSALAFEASPIAPAARDPAPSRPKPAGATPAAMRNCARNRASRAGNSWRVPCPRVRAGRRASASLDLAAVNGRGFARLRKQAVGIAESAPRNRLRGARRSARADQGATVGDDAEFPPWEFMSRIFLHAGANDAFGDVAERAARRVVRERQRAGSVAMLQRNADSLHRQEDDVEIARRRSATRSIQLSMIMASTPSGRCGPCCSMAAMAAPRSRPTCRAREYRGSKARTSTGRKHEGLKPEGAGKGQSAESFARICARPPPKPSSGQGEGA